MSASRGTTAGAHVGRHRSLRQHTIEGTSRIIPEAGVLTARPVGGAAGQLGRKVFWDARWRQVRDAVVVVAFEDYVFEAAAQGLRNVAPDERADVYVVSFFVYDEADDPRAPTLTVGTNTETQVQLASDPPADFQKPNPWWTPARSEEARWNYAFWRQDRLASVADTGLDPIGAALRERWIRDLGLSVEEPVNDDWAEFETNGAAISQAFVRMCVSIVQRVHADGVIS
jgi:hypothetical protein